jgi:hypothetical protein
MGGNSGDADHGAERTKGFDLARCGFTRHFLSSDPIRGVLVFGF